MTPRLYNLLGVLGLLSLCSGFGALVYVITHSHWLAYGLAAMSFGGLLMSNLSHAKREYRAGRNLI